jgi:DnaJ-class molecular chaperone
MPLVICQNKDCPLSEMIDRQYQDNSKGKACSVCGESLPSEHSSEDASDGEFADDVCLGCDGTGIIPSDIDSNKFMRCPSCNGKGFIDNKASDGKGE